MAFRRRLTALLILVCSAVFAGWAGAQSCVGDCDEDGSVAVNELVLGVNIALGSAEISACPSFDDGEGMVTIDRLIAAVNNALCGCGGCGTPASGTPTPTPGTTTPTAGTMTPTATPTGGVVVTMWRVDDYHVVSSDCAGVIEDAVMNGLQAAGNDFTVRQSGSDVEIEDEDGNTFDGTVDPDGTVHVRRRISGSVVTCDYDVDVDASANLSESPTTATYDGSVDLSGFCVGFSDCDILITARWTRQDGGG